MSAARGGRKGLQALLDFQKAEGAAGVGFALALACSCVIFRLARAGITAFAEVLVSGSLLATSHLGYAGETAREIVIPLVGTFMLGCFYAWAVRAGRSSLKPVITCHILIVVVLQPWLALAR